MVQKVQNYIAEQNMISPKDTILIGVSGGADSVALLLLLNTLYENTEVSLEVIHVEHGIRGEESKKDAEYVAELCRTMNVPYQCISVNVPNHSSDFKLGVEEAARELRYDVFSKMARQKGAKVALAHHMEDNAETILFQMIRGSALAGLCGMQPVRVAEDGVVYIRPLLGIHRTEIEEFLKRQKQNYRTDSTNEELVYSRNRLRHSVLPVLTQVNEQAVEHINETADTVFAVKDFLAQEVEKYWDRCVQKEEKAIYLRINEIQKLHLVLQKELLYRAIAVAAGSKKDISAIHVKALQQLLDNQSGKEVCLPYQLTAKKEYDRIRIFCQAKNAKTPDNKDFYRVTAEQIETSKLTGREVCVWLGEQGEAMTIRVFPKNEKNLQFPSNPYTKWLDYDKIKQGFCIRTRQSGDYFISDVFGHHKSLNRYFIDEKIPSGQRNVMWVLAQDDIVLWLVGGRISEHIKVTDKTNAIIELKYQGGKKDEC